jgi:predicted flap endonuclease-1-like 5' DNA nuclease
MNNVEPLSAYDLADASGEILIMLLISFVLGVMFGHLFSRAKKENVINNEKIIHLPAPLSRRADLLVPKGSDAFTRFDNLQIIEGIGPKIEEQLNKHGITSWFALAETPVTRLQEILLGNGEKFRAHKPNTWPQQARLAHEGRFEELEALKEILTGGRSS